MLILVLFATISIYFHVFKIIAVKQKHNVKGVCMFGILVLKFILKLFYALLELCKITASLGF